MLLTLFYFQTSCLGSPDILSEHARRLDIHVGAKPMKSFPSQIAWGVACSGNCFGFGVSHSLLARREGGEEDLLLKSAALKALLRRPKSSGYKVFVQITYWYQTQGCPRYFSFFHRNSFKNTDYSISLKKFKKLIYINCKIATIL